MCIYHLYNNCAYDLCYSQGSALLFALFAQNISTSPSNTLEGVVMNGADSKWVGVPSRVLQGSPLGAVLFFICINDIGYAVDTIKTLQMTPKSVSGCGQKDRRFQRRVLLIVC